MPQRALSLVMAVLGLLAVAGFFLAGFDVYREARTGPGWKRKLVVAGLFLLAAFGLVSCEDGSGAGAGDAATGAHDSTQDLPAGKALEETRQWRSLVRAWKDAEEISSGARGSYPFNRAGKKRMLDSLAAAAADVDALRGSGLLSAPAAELLRKDLALLVRGVQMKRPTEMRRATCYRPMMFTPARDGLKRLADRLPLLEKLADSGKLSPAVLSKVLNTIEEDIATLSKKKMLDSLPEAERDEAEETRRRAEAALGKIKELMGKTE